jgi:phosphoribosylformylglycinamidine (FGAM) synthase-like enzyme
VGARRWPSPTTSTSAIPKSPRSWASSSAALKGIGEACRALDIPHRLGQRLALQRNQWPGILPTPTIGGVGLDILLIGETTGWLGQSAWLREICGREQGAPPPVDLAAERRNGDFLRGLIQAGRVRTAHDLSEGGLAVALAEMAMASGLGARIVALPAGPSHAVLFGEDQARYLVAVAPAETAALLDEAKAAGVPLARLGVTGGDSLDLPGEAPISVAELARAHESWLPDYMAAGVP